MQNIPISVQGMGISHALKWKGETVTDTAKYSEDSIKVPFKCVSGNSRLWRPGNSGLCPAYKVLLDKRIVCYYNYNVKRKQLIHSTWPWLQGAEEWRRSTPEITETIGVLGWNKANHARELRHVSLDYIECSRAPCGAHRVTFGHRDLGRWCNW